MREKLEWAELLRCCIWYNNETNYKFMSIQYNQMAETIRHIMICFVVDLTQWICSVIDRS